MNKFYMVLNLTILVLFTILCVTCNAETRINLVSEKNNMQIGEEFKIKANIDKTNIAAFTVWIYFDNEKVDCISKSDYLNIVENRIVYMWFSDTGKNKSLEELLELRFKAKKDGIASFSIIGEFYNEEGDKIDIDYNNLSVNIGEAIENTEKTTEEIQLNLEDENVSDNNANLEIMRLGLEGITPDFNPNIQDYYLIIDETINSINVTAIPANRDAQVKVTGNNNLKKGKNIIKIEITSKDKTNTKTYTINVTKTDKPENANAELETLAVENYKLNPEFYNNITNYEITISNDTSKLNILAIPNDINAKVKIIGNESLKEGKNRITVTVTAVDNITTKIYNINIYKRSISEEKEFEETKRQSAEDAKAVLQKMNNENLIQPDKSIISLAEEENQNQKAENNNFVIDKILILVGITLSIAVIGIVIVRIKKSK